jgi:hypothetical protein
MEVSVDRFKSRLYRAVLALGTIAGMVVVLGADRQW